MEVINLRFLVNIATISLLHSCVRLRIRTHNTTAFLKKLENIEFRRIQISIYKFYLTLSTKLSQNVKPLKP